MSVFDSIADGADGALTPIFGSGGTYRVRDGKGDVTASIVFTEIVVEGAAVQRRRDDGNEREERAIVVHVPTDSVAVPAKRDTFLHVADGEEYAYFSHETVGVHHLAKFVLRKALSRAHGDRYDDDAPPSMNVL